MTSRLLLAGSATTRSSPENPSRSSANEATGCIEPLAVCAGGPKYGLVGGGVGLGEGEGLGDGAGVGVAVTRGPRPPKTVSRPEVETAMLASRIANVDLAAEEDRSPTAGSGTTSIVLPDQRSRRRIEVVGVRAAVGDVDPGGRDGR